MIKTVKSRVEFRGLVLPINSLYGTIPCRFRRPTIIEDKTGKIHKKWENVTEEVTFYCDDRHEICGAYYIHTWDGSRWHETTTAVSSGFKTIYNEIKQAGEADCRPWCDFNKINPRKRRPQQFIYKGRYGAAVGAHEDHDCNDRGYCGVAPAHTPVKVVKIKQDKPIKPVVSVKRPKIDVKSECGVRNTAPAKVSYVAGKHV